MRRLTSLMEKAGALQTLRSRHWRQKKLGLVAAQTANGRSSRRCLHLGHCHHACCCGCCRCCQMQAPRQQTALQMERHQHHWQHQVQVADQEYRGWGSGKQLQLQRRPLQQPLQAVRLLRPRHSSKQTVLVLLEVEVTQ